MAISDFVFSIVDSKGVSHTIIPEHFRIHDFFMLPSRLDLKVNYDLSDWDGGQDFAGKVIVAEGTGRPFIGHVEEIDNKEVPILKDPRSITCYSLHNLLRYRLLTHRFYSQTWGLLDTLSNVMGSIGILNDANHSFPQAIWHAEVAPPANVWYCYIARAKLPTPTIYLGTTLLTKAVDVASLLPNQFYQGDIQIWICTPGLAPDEYPAYVSSTSVPFRDTHIRPAPAGWNGYNDNGLTIPFTCCPQIMESAFDFLFRMISSAGKEMRFFNQADNMVYLAFKTMVGNATVKTYTDEHVISLREITLPSHGYKSITYHTADGTLTYWEPEEEDGSYEGYFWKEKRVTGFRMTPDELRAAARYEYYHKSGAKAYVVEVLYDGTVGIGDQIRIQKGSKDFTWRVWEKIVDSNDKGKMTLILHDWGWT